MLAVHPVKQDPGSTPGYDVQHHLKHHLWLTTLSRALSSNMNTDPFSENMEKQMI